ncbi:MAG: mechanosensitive ion channel family protein [Candidatus Hadarchaeales archaeon]
MNFLEWWVLRVLLIFVVFLLGGLIFRKVLDSYLRKLTARTKLGEVILSALRTPVLLIFILVGLNFALPEVPSIPPEVEERLPLLFSLLLIPVGALAAVRLVTGLLRYYFTKHPESRVAVPIFSRVIKVFVYLVAFLLILHLMGIDITALVAGLGIAGIAIAFALQETLSHFFAGLYLMSERPIRVGDFVELETGQQGYVVDVGWRSTRIRELPNNIIVVPNSKLAGMVVKNYSLPEPEMACLVNAGVSYDSDLEKVERVTIEVAKNTMKRLGMEFPGFEPFIRYNSFGEFSVNFTVVMRVREFTDKYLLTHQFIKELHKRYREEGIVIPFPIRTVYLRDGKKEN